MPFPGMDPYLEDAKLWPGFHNSLAVYIRDQLQPRLRPRYVAALEERVFVEADRQVVPDVGLRRNHSPETLPSPRAGIDQALIVQVPEVEVHESYVEILDTHSDMRVVTVIEILSPANKRPGPGQDAYRSKQAELLSSLVHLVEIDLLRSGAHTLAVPEWAARQKGPYHYLACVSRAAPRRDTFALYPRTVRDRLPVIGVPLLGPDPDVPLDIQAVVEQAHEAGAYADRIDYGTPPEPPFTGEDAAFVASVAATQGRP